MTNALLSALSIAGAAYGASAASTTSLTSVESATATSPTLVVSTAVASASLIPTASTLPSQLPLPPKQAWCPSEIFCAGAVLQTLNLAQLYADPKTVADKPTSRPPQQVLSDFNSTIGTNSYPTEGSVLNFTQQNFAGEGQELAAVSIPSFDSNPKFLSKVKDNVVKQWSKTVNGYWTQLIRDTNQTNVCKGGECESSLIPLNHTFVVPGGRFREQYYWDSFWIVEGLLRSELYSIANATLQNFMDELENFGFIPNGGRIYYLDRSQPPLFTHMVSVYVNAANDTSILKRALPLAQRELKWWDDHRSVNVTSGTNKTHILYRYAVNNTAPRPESYFQDYTTASDASLPGLDETQRSALYAELASGAESGWDYSSRWFASPDTSGNTALRSLQVSKTIPVDLNSILYNAHVLLAALHKQNGEQTSSSTIKSLTTRAAELKAAILDTFWDDSKFAFYDYVLSNAPSPIAAVSNSVSFPGNRSSVFSAAHFYPLWVGVYPPSVLANSTAAFNAFSSVNLILNRYNGTLPATLRTTGQQWDAPNAWPPHQYIALEALRGLPSNVTSNAWPLGTGKSSFELIPSGQLGLDESALPQQPLYAGTNASRTGTASDVNTLNGTVVNGGNATQGEGWGKAMQRALANRYVTSALCSWRATGGAIDGVLPRLSDQELNVTQSVNNTGNMFEKFSAVDVDSAGRGGEYTVQAGFGWTNGVVLWVADTYGDVLIAPSCPDLLASAEAAGSASSSASSSGTGTSSAGASGTGSGSQPTSTGAAGRVEVGVMMAMGGAFVASVMML